MQVPSKMVLNEAKVYMDLIFLSNREEQKRSAGPVFHKDSL